MSEVGGRERELLALMLTDFTQEDLRAQGPASTAEIAFVARLLGMNPYRSTWGYTVQRIDLDFYNESEAKRIRAEADAAWNEFDAELLDAKIADVFGQPNIVNRRPNPKRTQRQGRRYKLVEDHGTAIARKQITATRQERQREARQHRRNKHYTPAWKLRNQQDERRTWGDANTDMTAIYRWGITEGLHHLSIRMCTDPGCCSAGLPVGINR